MAKKTKKLSDPRIWIKDLDIKTTEEIAIPKMLIDQVIGQEQGSEIVRKAAEQKRHVMLIGDPGTGKSMLAQSISEKYPGTLPIESAITLASSPILKLAIPNVSVCV